MTLERDHLKRIVEAALFAAGQPMSLEKLGELFYEDERPTNEAFREILAEIESDYRERGVQLKEVASGFRFQASHEVGEWVSRLWEEKPQRYSRALLETLALIAYRQPITRGEVEDIRGVSVSSHIIKTLQEREWVRVLGYRDVPGRPAMYGTTRTFLDYFSLKSLEDLPTLAEVRDLDKISAELDERLQQAQPQTTLPLDAVVTGIAPGEATSSESLAGETAAEHAQKHGTAELEAAEQITAAQNTEAEHNAAEASCTSEQPPTLQAQETPAFDAPERDVSEPNSAEPGIIEPDASEPGEPKLSAHRVPAQVSLETAETVQAPPAATAPTAPPAQPAIASPQTTFATLRARFSSIFDAPVDAAPDVRVPATQADAPPTESASDANQSASLDDQETPPSPIDPRDPRLE